jgi:hypothetical protein
LKETEMAKYRQLMVQGETGWHLISPTNAWEALRIAWMIWRYPDRVAALVGVSQEYMLENQTPHAAQPEQSPAGCECHRCIKEYDLRMPGRLYPLNATKMILCPSCRNKRCPKASDHRLDCTDSNESGQPGSVYTNPPAAQPTYPLPDNLYESKDWQAGNYAERVEWLHGMYESKKQELEAYLDPAQRPWVELTASTILNMMPGSIPAEHDGALMEFARDIEAKLKERNT